MEIESALGDAPAPTQRVLITGATGFVGGAIARHLSAKGYAVRIAVRDEARIEGADFERAAVGDLGGPVDWGRALDGMNVVVHAAGLAHQPRSVDDGAMFRINAEATARLAMAARQAGVRRFLFVSSIRAIAGACSGETLTDETPPAPTDAYGRSKLEGEQAALAVGAGASILRPTPVCGAGARGYFRLMARIAATPFPLPVGGLSGRRSFVTDRNLAHAAAMLISHEDAIGRSFLVAEPAPLTAAEFVVALREARGASARVFEPPRMFASLAARMPGLNRIIERLTQDLVVDCSALRAIGWSPIEDSRAGLRRMAGLDQALVV